MKGSTGCVLYEITITSGIRFPYNLRHVFTKKHYVFAYIFKQVNTTFNIGESKRMGQKEMIKVRFDSPGLTFLAPVHCKTTRSPFLICSRICDEFLVYLNETINHRFASSRLEIVK